jgi:hypothetical protein
MPRIEQPLNQIHLIPPNYFRPVLMKCPWSAERFIWTASSTIFRAILHPEKVQSSHISDCAIARNMRCGLSVMHRVQLQKLSWRFSDRSAVHDFAAQDFVRFIA